jgi:hypothetical protein
MPRQARKTEVQRIGAARPEPVIAVLGGRTTRMQRIIGCMRVAALAAITPLLEKNAIKNAAVDVPVVFSMSRVVVLAFAVGMMRQLWKVGLTSWPEATLAMTVVLALPMLGALERANPEQTLDVLKTIVGRYGVGDQRTGLSLFPHEAQEPSKFDNHWSD